MKKAAGRDIYLFQNNFIKITIVLARSIIARQKYFRITFIIGFIQNFLDEINWKVGICNKNNCFILSLCQFKSLISLWILLHYLKFKLQLQIFVRFILHFIIYFFKCNLIILLLFPSNFFCLQTLLCETR